jgi:hypothetical protein
MMKAIKRTLLAAIIIFCFNNHATRSDDNQSVFDLILTNVEGNTADLSITGTITLKNKTDVGYTVPYFLFGLRNPTIVLTLDGREIGYDQILLETSAGSLTTVDPRSAVDEDFSLGLRKADLAESPSGTHNPGVYKIRLQAKYRSVYSDFRSNSIVRNSPTNLWLGELSSNTVEMQLKPGY